LASIVWQATACMATEADYQTVRDRLQDMDQDGERSTQYGGSDCDDRDGSVHSNAAEVCNGVDDDCDGQIDEEASDALEWFADADGDGYGNPALSLVECTAPASFVDNDHDCDDGDADVSPETVWFVDADDDGFGNPDYQTQQCEAPPGHSLLGTDCDDGASEIHPDATEICDEADNNCDGSVDVDATDQPTWYPDSDEDGFGAENQGQTSCEGPEDWITQGEDCNDSFDDQYPGAPEICRDRRDNDCDGTESGCLFEGEVGIIAAGAVRFSGGSNGGHLGASLFEIGDVSGSGWTNVAVGAPSTSDGGTVALFSGGFTEGTLDTVGGIRITSDSPGQEFGASMTSMPDSDGDGFPDLVVGAPSHDTSDYSIGAVLVFASNNILGGTTPADASAIITGNEARQRLGESVAFIGTALSDADALAVGAPFDRDYSLTEPGEVYLFATPLSSELDADDAEFSLSGENNDDRAGALVASAGDLDGDGYDELLVGADQYETSSALGAVYLLYGPVTTSQGLSDADYRLVPSTKDRVGTSVGTAADHDGDGYLDLLIGAPSHSSSVNGAGAVHIILGPSPTSDLLDDANATLKGDVAGEAAGTSVSGTGDVNSDGWLDVLVGADGRSAEGSPGAAYLVMGPISGSVILSEAQAKLTGESEADQFGSAVLLETENSSGYSRLWISAHLYTDETTQEGAVYQLEGNGW